MLSLCCILVDSVCVRLHACSVMSPKYPLPSLGGRPLSPLALPYLLLDAQPAAAATIIIYSTDSFALQTNTFGGQFQNMHTALMMANKTRAVCHDW